MKIISKAKDYYDYLPGVYGIDEKIVYVRESKVEESSKYLTPHRNNSPYELELSKDKTIDVDIVCMEVWVCNKRYPALEIMNAKHFTQKRLAICYSLEEAEDWLDILGVKEWTINHYKEFFKENKKVDKDLNTKYSCPQLVIRENMILSNPILKEWEFHKVLDSNEIYQEISMFVAAKPDVSQTIPTDLDRFEAKGFDRKTSFRKM